MNESPVVSLVTTKSDAEVAEDIKARVNEILADLLPIFDEATAAGLMIAWDAIAPAPPFFKHKVHGLKIIKHF
jgi:hypothetical protein